MSNRSAVWVAIASIPLICGFRCQRPPISSETAGGGDTTVEGRCYTSEGNPVAPGGVGQWRPEDLTNETSTDGSTRYDVEGGQVDRCSATGSASGHRRCCCTAVTLADGSTSDGHVCSMDEERGGDLVRPDGPAPLCYSDVLPGGRLVEEGHCAWFNDGDTQQLCRCREGTPDCAIDACLVAGPTSSEGRPAQIRDAEIPRDGGESRYARWLEIVKQHYLAGDDIRLEDDFSLLAYGGQSTFPTASAFLLRFLNCQGDTRLERDDLYSERGEASHPDVYQDRDTLRIERVHRLAYWHAMTAAPAQFAAGRRSFDVGSWIVYANSEDVRRATGRMTVRVRATFSGSPGNRSVALRYTIDDVYDWNPERFTPDEPAFYYHAAGKRLSDTGRACTFAISIEWTQTESVDDRSLGGPCREFIGCLEGLGGANCAPRFPYSPGYDGSVLDTCLSGGGGLSCFEDSCFDIPDVCSGVESCVRGRGGLSCFSRDRCR